MKYLFAILLSISCTIYCEACLCSNEIDPTILGRYDAKKEAIQMLKIHVQLEQDKLKHILDHNETYPDDKIFNKIIIRTKSHIETLDEIKSMIESQIECDQEEYLNHFKIS